MPEGYRGEGIFHSAPMAADTTINKGDVVAFDASGNLVVAPANEKSPIGVSSETRTSGTGENPELAYVRHGIAQAKAVSAVSAGDAVRVSGTAGQLETMPKQAVDEGGTATYDIEPNEKLGRALEDIAADALGDIFVGGA